MKKIIHYAKKILPWVFALIIFIYLFHLYPLPKVLKAISYVNLWSFGAFVLGYFLFIYVIDSLVFTYAFRKYGYTVHLKDIFLARAVTYLIMIINYPASQVAFAYYLNRRYQIPVFQAMGVFLLIIFIDLLWIINLALVGSFFQQQLVMGLDIGHTVRSFALAAYIFTFIWLAFWRRWPQKILGRPLFRWRFLEKQMGRQSFRVFQETKVKDMLILAVMRIPIHFTIIISMYVILLTFGVHIPFTKVLGNVPIVFFIGTLPITPGGLGTTNAAMVELLYPYVTGSIFSTGQITPQELIFAATLLWMFANYILKTVFGTFTLRKVSKHLFELPPEKVEEKMEKQAAHLGGNI
ncbi:MAG: lysylphosphatidylglycerol synthase transmembrane domain-containing protein [Pseudomonadota bacterium]